MSGHSSDSGRVTTFGFIVTVQCSDRVSPDWIRRVISDAVTKAIDLPVPTAVHCEFCGEVESEG